MPNPPELLQGQAIETDLEIRSESEREIAVRFMRYGEIGVADVGPEMFEPGSFADADAHSVILRSEHEGPPAGRGTRIEDDAVGPVLIARAAPTPRGDELMTLAKEGYFRGASPMYRRVEGGTRFKTVDGQRVTVHSKVDLREVSLTWRPTYKGTEVLYARTEEETSVAEDQTVEPVEAKPQARGLELPTDVHTYADFKQRLENLEQRSEVATSVVIPEIEAEDKLPYRGDWMKAALTLMDGGALQPMEKRVLADIISDDNPAFMPTFISDQLIGVIDPSRPFLGSTSRIDMPESGLEISYPRIVTRPTVGEQMTEKAEVTSTAVETDRVTAPVRTFAGAGDLSLQLLRRSSPQFLSFYMEILGEAYARVTENAAVDALLAAGVTAGTGDFDPEAPTYAEAIQNGIAVGRSLVPNRIWLSTAAMSAFIDAKTPTGGGGEPMYPGLAVVAGVSGPAAGGPLPVSLLPVWTPALDDEAVDLIIGPSRGFSWAEEGTFTLQADVPGRLGRDVALGGFMAFVAAYPAAFTTYTVPS